MKKKKTIFLKKFWKIFIVEFFLFSLTLVLGITTAFKSNKILTIQKIEIPQISFWRFIFQFFLASIFIFLIIRLIKTKKKKRLIFKILFVLTIFLGGVLMLSVWIPDIISLILISVLILWWWKQPSILIQDLCIILAIAGVGSILGLTLAPEIVMALLIIFSVYDFIAVYKTKHMIEMAKEMVKSRAVLGLIIPPNLSAFFEPLKEIKSGGKFLILGGGDIVFPLLFCCSLIPFGILKSLIVGFFSLIGLSVSFWFFLSQKKRQPIPALPPIALFSILGYLITKLI
ncbi:MAG: presenilin family intramembrane aspartyl protease [Candidatus Nealsonbacteria bacterium]